MQLPETVTLAQATALLQQLETALAGLASPGTLQVDASLMSAFDTAAVALLLQARRLAEQHGLGFQIQAAPAKLFELADLYGVAGLLSLSAPAEVGRSSAT